MKWLKEVAEVVGDIMYPVVIVVIFLVAMKLLSVVDSLLLAL